jgi:thymidylate synthase
MKQYLDLIKKVMDDGVDRPDRTGTGTRATFGEQLRFDLTRGFPAVTTKKLAFKAMVSELLWFIEGSGDEKRLKEILHGDRESPKKTIWSGNANAPYWTPKAKFEGDLGVVYGVQWRKWKGPLFTITHDEYVAKRREHGLLNKQSFNEFVESEKVICSSKDPVTGEETVVMQEIHDQLMDLVDGLTHDPYGRRHVLSAWNPGELENMALPPCHMFAQFFVAPLDSNEINESYADWYDDKGHLERKVIDVDRHGLSRASRKKTVEDLEDVGLPTHKLSCQMYQRSGDAFLGIPFNIASYSLLVHMLAQVCGYRVGEFVHVIGDTHIYHNHFDQVAEQLKRTPMALPGLWLNPEIRDITKFTMDDIKLTDYHSYDSLPAPMAV